MNQATLAQRVVAEGLGTAFLLATAIGSGIMAERLAGGNVALALLANTLATGAGLAALILTFGPISGAHFNPVVTLADATQGGIAWRHIALHRGPSTRGVWWRGRGASYVRRAVVLDFAAWTRGGGAVVE